MKILGFLVRDSYFSLLACLGLCAILFPVFGKGLPGKIAFDLLLTGIVISGIFVLRSNRAHLITALALAAVAILGTWSAYLAPELKSNPIIVIGTVGSFILFFPVLMFAVLKAVFTAKKITSDVIAGSICVYILLGMTFANIFWVLEFIFPGSMNFNTELVNLSHGRQGPAAFLYYSFVTLTTLGYGDITPRVPATQVCSVVEAVIGQLYVAIFVARLVALNVAESLKSDS